MSSLGDSAEATTLQKRIGLVEAVQELVQCRDLLRMDPEELDKYYQLLAAHDVEASMDLKMKVIAAEAQKKVRAMLFSKKEEDMRSYLEVIIPFNKTECQGFSYFQPTFNCAVLETLSSDMCMGGYLALTDGAMDTATDMGAMSLPPLMDVQAPQPYRSNSRETAGEGADTDWEACLFIITAGSH